jgi:hypothetical protein
MEPQGVRVMSKFTEVYTKAQNIAATQKFAEPDWHKFMTDTCGVKVLFGAKGLNSGKAESPEKLRKKVAEAAKDIKLDRKQYAKKEGKVIFDACQNDKSNGKWNERAGLIEFMRHLYRAQKTGGQDVWVYSPAIDYKKPVFDELSGGDATVKRKLGYQDEIFSKKERDLMCDALHCAKKVSMDALAKLGKKDKTTLEVVKRWFIDDDSADKVDEAVGKLKEGFKAISASCGSTSLVFTDYLDWRKERKKYFGAAFRGGEGGGFPIIYLEGAFTRLAGNSGKLWLCAETIVHELSHHDVSTHDHKYDSEGLKPKKTFPYSSTIENADSWGYFAIDLAGYLSASDRKKTLK